MRRPPLWVRKLLRPLIPDRLMARFRLAEHSRQVRTNIDVFLPAGSAVAEGSTTGAFYTAPAD